MITKDTWKKGWASGWKTSWVLGKIVFPITFIVGILKYTPVLDWVSIVFKPLMSFVGLPGEAAIPLALAFILNLYAGIGGILSLSLEVKEVFILAIMMSFAHNLLVETAVTTKMGVPTWVSLSIRLGLAGLSAWFIDRVWQGGSEKAQYGLMGATDEPFQSWGWVIGQALMNSATGLLQLIVVVIPLMMAIQLLKDGNVLQWIAKVMRPFTRLIGLPDNASVTLMAGIFFGLAFGAGVLLQAVEEEKFSKRDLFLLVLFLAACHAVVEDTLIFIPLGIPVIYLLIIRFLVAFLATMVAARIILRVTHRQNVQKGA
jgi:hypothetical protein